MGKVGVVRLLPPKKTGPTWTALSHGGEMVLQGHTLVHELLLDMLLCLERAQLVILIIAHDDDDVGPRARC